MSYGNDYLEMRMSYIDELFNAGHNELDRIEGLIQTAIIEHEAKEELYRELKGVIDQQRAEELLEYLYKNQIDPIQSGGNYGQTDIKNKLKREI